MFNPELWEYCGNDIERIQSIGYASESFLSGFFLAESEDRKPGHPDAPPVTGSFPAPWQSMSNPERRHRAHIRNDTTTISLAPFQIAHWGFAKDVAHYVESHAQRMRAELPPNEGLKPIRPGICISNAETLLVEIGWGHFTNDEIATCFRHWVKHARPKNLRAPRGQGHKPGDWRAQLTRLAVMRLLSRFTPLGIVDPRQDKFPAVWDTKQFSRPKWRDVTKWHDARREAGKLFRSLFPFLPPDEKPISWERQPPGK